MAKGVNKVLLLGNVGKEPEIRATTGGTIVANFSIATADRQKDAQGNWADKTEWHNIIAFARTAEIVRDYVNKGSQLYIEGKLQTRSWDDNTSGQKKYRTEIIVNELTLLDGAPASDKAKPAASAKDTAQSASADYDGLGITDDNIPF